MADTKISALTELTDPVSGDWIPITDTSAAQTKKLDFGVITSGVITPEQYGCVGDGVTDDTTNLQSAIDAATTNHWKLVGIGSYKVTSTIRIGPAAGSGHAVFDIELGTGADHDSSNNGLSGIQWGGGNNDVIVEITRHQRTKISLTVNNYNSATDMTGILIHNLDNSVTASNHNYYPYVTVAGCELAMQWGDLTNDTWNTNFDDNYFDFVRFYDCTQGLLIDSTSQDNNVINYFHSGGTPSVAANSREYIVRVLANGNGFRINYGMFRTDDMAADAPIIDIQDGSFSCEKISMEGEDGCLPLWIRDGIDRDPCVIKNIYTTDKTDSNGQAMRVDYKGHTTLLGCSVFGTITHTRSLTAVGTVFNEPFVIITGTHDGGNGAATLSDSTRGVSTLAWVLDAFIGQTIENVTDGSTGLITDSGASTITATLSGGTNDDWDDGDTYQITTTGFLSAGSNSSLTSIGMGTRAAEGDVVVGEPYVIGTVTGRNGNPLTGNIFSNTVKNVVYANLTANRSVINPSNEENWKQKNAEMTYVLNADGSDRTVNWGTDFYLDNGDTATIVVANTTTVIKFIYIGDDQYLETSRRTLIA